MFIPPFIRGEWRFALKRAAFLSTMRFVSIFFIFSHSPPKVEETRFKIRSDIFFFLFSVDDERSRKQKGSDKCAETWSASFRFKSEKLCNFYRKNVFLPSHRHNLLPPNDSLTQLPSNNVKSTLLRWLSLWSVLLDGMLGVGDVHVGIFNGDVLSAN